MELTKQEEEFWDLYLSSIGANIPSRPNLEVSIIGDETNAEELLALYLSGKKTAGSSLEKDYIQAGDDLPQVGNYWMVLDSSNAPKCLLKTVRVEYTRFSDIELRIAIAEGEGDLSLAYWRKAHIDFFTPYLAQLKISNLESEILVTEFYELVHK
jgi:uncharacterized protein YhfF